MIDTKVTDFLFLAVAGTKPTSSIYMHMRMILKQLKTFGHQCSANADALDNSVTGSMNDQKRYTVRYRESNWNRIESCYYADDAFEAKKLAAEAVPYIRDHPHSIELIRCEESRQT